jgi:hypothetical protein
MNTQERDAKEYLENKLGRPLTKLGEYHPFDFYDEAADLFIEFKSRTNSKDKYPTTMVGFNKVKWLKDNGKNKAKFVFKFTDGYFDIDYELDKFSRFDVKEGGRYDRGRAEISKYIWIPILALVSI